MKGHLLGKEKKGLDRMVAEPTCRRELPLGYFRRHQAVGCPRVWAGGKQKVNPGQSGESGMWSSLVSTLHWEESRPPEAQLEDRHRPGVAPA